MRIELGKGCVLQLGSSDDGELHQARVVDRVWKLEAEAGLRYKKPAYLYKRAGTHASIQDHSSISHPDLEAEIWVISKHEGATLELAWEGPDPVPWAECTLVKKDNPNTSRPSPGEPGPEDAKKARIAAGTAGTVWLRHGNGRLPISVIPRNLLDSEKKLEDKDESERSKALEEAILRLSAMVGDLWREALSPWSDPKNDTAAGMRVTTGKQDVRWWQRLTRLDQLLHEGGVIQAWQQLLADPFVEIRDHFPITTMLKARSPVLSGPRGPWSLCGGWSPYQPLGKVHERIARRTVDTPPNRLALRLALLVAMELETIAAARRRAAVEATGKNGKETPNASDWTGLDQIIEKLRVATEEVIHHPLFTEVDREAFLALDSPSLQNNARCRPLLDAWDKLSRGLQLPDDLDLASAMLQPLQKTHVLYERWCFLHLRDRLSSLCHLSNPPTIQQGIGFVLCEFDVPDALLAGGVFRISLYHTTARGTVIKYEESERRTGDGEEDLTERWAELVSSWTKVHEPDGLIVVERRQAAESSTPYAVFAWDAKYSRINPTKSSNSMYQAHAFRDALLWNEGPTPISWSMVLHVANLHTEPCTLYPRSNFPRNGPLPLKETSQPGTYRSGGLAFSHCAPLEERESAHVNVQAKKSEGALKELLRNLCRSGGLVAPVAEAPNAMDLV